MRGAPRIARRPKCGVRQVVYTSECAGGAAAAAAETRVARRAPCRRQAAARDRRLSRALFSAPTRGGARDWRGARGGARAAALESSSVRRDVGHCSICRWGRRELDNERPRSKEVFKVAVRDTTESGLLLHSTVRGLVGLPRYVLTKEHADQRVCVFKGQWKGDEEESDGRRCGERLRGARVAEDRAAAVRLALQEDV